MLEIKDLPSILPHRGRMLLLSKITGYNLEERSLEAEYYITENCLFFDPTINNGGGGIPCWVGFECIAQAIAAISGIRGLENGEKPRIGYILSVSKMQSFIPVLKSGSTVAIKAKQIGCIALIYKCNGQIFLEGEKALEGKLTVMEVSENFSAGDVSVG
jgi:predicted hotdog family 3-hydroxylacyl-ACP dehydratase